MRLGLNPTLQRFLRSLSKITQSLFGIKTKTEIWSVFDFSEWNQHAAFYAGASTFDPLNTGVNEVDSSPFSYHAAIDFSPLRCFSFPLSALSPNPSLTRHLGLDLVPRKEFEMVDPDQISISELYKLVSRARWFLKQLLRNVLKGFEMALGRNQKAKLQVWRNQSTAEPLRSPLRLRLFFFNEIPESTRAKLLQQEQSFCVFQRFCVFHPSLLQFLQFPFLLRRCCWIFPSGPLNKP